jgi:hypothetical protein
MNSSAPTINTGQAVATNFDVKEQAFEENEKGIPIAGKYSYPNGSTGNAIGEYKIPPSTGTHVLGSINGVIQWIATEACDE